MQDENLREPGNSIVLLKQHFEKIPIDSICSGEANSLHEVDKKGLPLAEEIINFQSEHNSDKKYSSNSNHVLKMIQAEWNKVNHLRKTVFRQYSNDMRTAKRIIIQNLNSRENICLQKQELKKSLNETKNVLHTLHNNESHLKIQISEKEKTLQELKRSLDEAKLQISKAVLERTKFMKERDCFEKHWREYKEKYDSLLSESSDLHMKLAKLEHENAQFHNQLALKETNLQHIHYKNGTFDVDYSDDSAQGMYIIIIKHSEVKFIVFLVFNELCPNIQ